MKHVVFLLPGLAGRPGGGIKVVFEYSNMLVRNGVQVSIIYPSSLFWTSCSLIDKIKAILRFIVNKLLNKYDGRTWFDLDKRVGTHLVFSLAQNHIPQATHYVATAVQTALYLNKYKTTSKKLYFIQGYEDWNPDISVQTLLSTYRFDMHKIVVSRWLQSLLHEQGEECHYIANGFNFNYFQQYIPQENRDPFTVSLMYHTNPAKGFGDALEALSIVKQIIPELKVLMFGVYDLMIDLPSWFQYFYSPDQSQHNYIYNTSSIYVAPSHNEGFGLTVGEAMICGAAVVCTNTRGYLEMAENEKNALVVPIKSPELLANAIIRLINNNKLRYMLSNNAMAYISSFTWESAYHNFSKVLFE